MDLKKYIRNVADFPIKGVNFKDITTLLQEPKAFKYAIDRMNEKLKGLNYDVLIAPESRGFIFASPLAYLNDKPLVLVRKKGKLPYKTLSCDYELEYGLQTLEIHIDSIKKGQKIVIIEDLLATGGTIKAIKKMVEELGGEIVKSIFLIELDFLKPRETLKDIEIDSVLVY